jgi:ATP-binding cassette subfamily F protein 2
MELVSSSPLYSLFPFLLVSPFVQASHLLFPSLSSLCSGKSTLLKLMVGDIKPIEGQIRRHLHLKIARYNQHSNDQLDPNSTVLDFVRASFPEKKTMDEPEWRQAVGRYGVTGAQQKALISTLSDGIKSRVVFCMIALEQPNLIVFDEPTNHLDFPSIVALGKAINSFQGGVVLVSHDFRLLSQVAKEIWVCDHGKIERWPGDIYSYKKSLVQQMIKERDAEEQKS